MASTQPMRFDPTLLPRSAAIVGGRLVVAGVDAEALADEFGTPVYVYDEAEMRARCREYRVGFPDGVSYASKAFLCGAMARLIAEEGLGLDVASGGELAIALAAGVDPSSITVHGNNKSDDELFAAMSAPAKAIVLDSTDELDRIERLVAAEAPVPSLLVRVNPGIDAHTHEYLATGATDSKFGFSLESGAALAAVEAIVQTNAARFAGLHAHIGSQIFRPEGFDAALARLAGLVRDIETRFGIDVDELCIGGGLGVRYTTGDDPPSIGQHAAAVRESFGDALGRAGVACRPRLTTEPGRSIVAPAGITLYRVGTIKTVPGIRTYVSVDGGISDNLRPALYGAQYEAFVTSRADADRDAVVTIAGKHCEQGDLLVRDARLPADLAVGELVATPCTGAYGHAMANNYNSIVRPAVVFVADGAARAVVRRETLADLVARDVVLGDSA